MSYLDKLEKRIREIFENSSSLLSWTGQDERMVRRLCEAIQAVFSHETPRDLIRPAFQIAINPALADLWRKQEDWDSKLTNLLVRSATEFGFSFRMNPEVTILPDSALADEDIIIFLEDADVSQTGETGIISLPVSDYLEPTNSRKPILILQGGKTIELIQPVINIGRKSSNQIIIEDLRVSRTHAQLRKIKGDYMIFDVGSTGGTFINSTRIDQHTLRPGDVISLAGFTMIYTLDQSPLEETQKGITSEIKSKNEESTQ